MGDDSFDVRAFQNWALGNLVDNSNRGMFAEWLVGQALDGIGEGDVHQEWDAFDLQYGEITVEVKASGLSQTWSPDQRTIPRFDIAPRKWTWREATGKWTQNNPPARFADVYVFCLHESLPATNKNVLDETSWKFWVISTQTLDYKLGPQKSIGLATLNGIANPVGWSDVRKQVDLSINKARDQ